MYKAEALNMIGKGKKALKLLQTSTKIFSGIKDQPVECISGIQALSLHDEHNYTINNIYTINLANLTLMFSESSKAISGNVNKALQAVEGYQNSGEDTTLPPPLHHTLIYFYLMNSKSSKIPASYAVCREYRERSALFEKETGSHFCSE